MGSRDTAEAALEATDLDLGPGLADGRQAERDTQVVLRAVAGDDALRFCVVPSRKTVTAGRDPDCELVLTDGSISRRHCTLRHMRKPFRLMLEDLGSTNGTKINGRPLQGVTPVEIGDELCIGNIPVRVEQLSLTELAKLSDMWARLQTTQVDALTGLLARRYLDDVVPLQLDSLRAAEVPVSLVLLDIDKLAAVNAHGRALGDGLLRVLGRLIREAIREQDRGVRYGGDELAILLPNCTEEGGLVMADRLLRTVAEHDWSRVLGPAAQKPVSLSLGVATWREEEPVSSCLRRAARAVYVAKQLGGSRAMPASKVA